MSQLRVISSEQVYELLPMDLVVDVVASVFRMVGTERLVQPVRTVVAVPGRSAVLGSMPAHVGAVEGGSFGVKVVVVDPANATRGLDTHQGLVTIFDPTTGRPRAIVEAGAVTALRTAAASGVATRALARAGADEVAILGAGVQARLHLAAMCSVMPVRRARVWARRPEAAEALAREATHRHSCPVVAAGSVAEATRGADIVCTTTSATSPVLTFRDVDAGTHINAVGACFPTGRELASDLVGAARVVVDVEDAARVEAGDLLLAGADGVDAFAGVAQLGAVLRGEHRGRVDDEEITVFESLGFAGLDVATSTRLCEEAEQSGVGTLVDLDHQYLS